MDNPNAMLRSAQLRTGANEPTADLRQTYRSDLLGGVVEIRSPGKTGDWGSDSLYRDVGAPPTRSRDVELAAIPYFAWANRGESDMTIWIRRDAT